MSDKGGALVRELREWGLTLPGAHGKAWETGTPVIQYDIAAGRQKALAFLAPTIEAQHQYVPGGTYGMKISEDGSTLCVNFNGQRCAALDPGRQRTTKINCLVYLRAVITAWGGMPPSVCQIPGE